VITVGVISVVTVTTVVFVLIYTPFYVTQHEPHDPYSVARRVLTSSPLVDGQVQFSRDVTEHKSFRPFNFPNASLTQTQWTAQQYAAYTAQPIVKSGFQAESDRGPSVGLRGMPRLPHGHPSTARGPPRLAGAFMSSA
jgi:hypothetical protein